jgi:DNA modification methylase
MIDPNAQWQIITGDCLEVMKHIPAGIVGAVVTDPPYGIEWAGHGASTLDWNALQNDQGQLDLTHVLRMSCTVVSFGANCYPNQLPHRGRWICWDKRTTEAADTMLGSPYELAWTNRTSGYDKIYRIMHGGVVNDDKWGEKRHHPTQKPIRLMSRILEDYTDANDVVLDPYCGSGTTGVACIRTGRRFIGIELDPKYADIARRRCAEAEPVLFTKADKPEEAKLWE